MLSRSRFAAVLVTAVASGAVASGAAIGRPAAAQERAATPEDETARTRGALIHIDLAGEAVVVSARYRLVAPDGRIELRAPKQPGAEIRVASVDGPPLELEARGGGWRLRGEVPPASRDIPVVVRYEIRGPVDRVPLFVPAGPMVDGGETEIRLTGAPEAGRPAKAFPRMTRGPGDTLIARLRDVPSIVVLPRTGVSLNDLLDGLVVIVILSTTASWVVIRFRSG